MNHGFLSRHKRPTRQEITLFSGASLDRARVHECSGLSRRVFALLVAQKTKGPILWITLAHMRETLNPEGIAPFISPEHFLFVRTKRIEDALWSMEEALRSPAPQLVIADIDSHPTLTPVRRLHLAAETGRTLGVLLTPEINGSQGVETRWHMRASHSDQANQWTLRRTRARTAPPRQWTLTETEKGIIAPLEDAQNDIETSAIN